MSSSKFNTFYKAFTETMVAYFQNTSLNGFGLLYYIRRRRYQRFFWFLFILLGVGFSVYVVLFILMSFLKEPTVTSLTPQSYEIWETPFPAVGICSVNKLSQRKMQAYAQDIANNNKRYNRPEYWYKKMELFAGYFDSTAVDFDEAADFQNELERDANETGSVKDILKMLVPTCNELLVKCRWAGKVVDCQEIVELYATVMGYCCIFNYQRGTLHDIPTPPLMPSGTGIEMGLTLLLNASVLDYFYAERNTNGFVVQIFDSNIFPDASTGAMQELFVTPGDDVEVQIKVVTQETAKEVLSYSAKQRRCYFEDENAREYDYAYSQVECLTRCKLRAIQSLCDCVPYYAPPDLLEANSSITYCTLLQVECLERYRVTLNTYRPTEEEQVMSPSLEQDLQHESMMCPDCLPLCSYSHYNYWKGATKLQETLLLQENRDFLANSESISGQLSLVKLYFPTPYAVRYHKNVLYNWYQILSNIGGVIGICTGCSLISGFEIIYFFGFRLFKKLYKTQ